MLRTESIEWLLDALWRTSWQFAVIAVIVGLVIIACRPWLTPTWRLALWCLPLARMLVLIIPASPMSLFGLLDVTCITNTTSSVFQNRSQVASAHDTATQSAWPVETVVVQTSVLQPLSPLTTEMGADIRTANPSLIPKSSRLGTIIIFVWIAGISISAMRIIENRRQIAAIVESGRTAQGRLAKIVQIRLQRLGIRRPVECLTTPHSIGPATVGLIRPKILIPETLARQLPHKSLVAIVEHELRHVQRWDGLLLSLLDFCKCLHWFNPIVYWCERNVRQSIEHGVDRSTLQTLGASNTQAYGELLIQIAQHSTPRFRVTRMASRGSTLRTRIKEITMPVISTPLRTAAALGLVTLLTITLLSDKATTQEATPKSTKPSESETSSQLENKLAQTDVISGVVVDEKGDPIVDAMIVSYPIVGSQEVRLITGHDGKFVIDLLQYPTARSNFKAAVFKAGHILSSVDSMKQPIRVILSESKSFEVDVRSPDGQPVQNALVTPGTVRFETFNAPPPESLDRDIATSTDANGRATLTSVQPAELLSLVINSGEWGKQQFALPRYPTTNQKTFVARLRKVGRVVGRITDKTGMPLQGFKFGCASSVLGANNSQGDSASTDVDGRFRMILPTGRYRFFASVGQEIAFEPVTVQISREKEVSLELQVQPPCEVSGRAITDSGLPLENLHVTAWRLGDSRTVLTDAQGHFVFKLPPGNWSYDCYPGETLGLLPNEHNEQAAFKVPEGGSMSLPTIIAKTGQIIEGQIQGIDLSVPRIRAVIAHVGKMSFGCQYDDTGRFQLTLPKSLAIENIEKFEIRFIDSPVDVVSTDPLVLALSTGPAPPISAKETLKKKMQGMLTANEKERALLVQAFKDFLEGVDVEANDLRGAMQIVSFLDSKGDRQLAESLCKLILAKHADREEFAAEIGWIQGTLGRLSLVGKPFDLSGREALSRNEFDWSAFRGKVVLVQFWATWCGPCKEDLKIALDLHERFSNQNFAVVGVSTDSDSAKLQGFLNDSDFPWPTIHSPVDAPENLSKKLGVSEIPFNFVIGADGKVLAVNRRHDELVRFVEAQFR